MTVVGIENAYMPAKTIRDDSFGYILYYIAEKDMTAGHTTLLPRIDKVCAVKSPPLRKPSEITFFPLFLPPSKPTRIRTHNILFYTGCFHAVFVSICHAGLGLKIIIIYRTRWSKTWDRGLNDNTIHFRKTNSLNMKLSCSKRVGIKIIDSL